MIGASIVVLDINVLLFDPEAIHGFPEKEIVLPVCIFEELDILKKDLGEKGRAAQVVSHVLDKCSKIGNLVEGVCLSNSSILRIDLSNLDERKIPYDFDSRNYSNHVLALAWELRQKHNKVVFVSRNENLRTKSEIIGVRAISYDGMRNDDSCLYSGIMLQTPLPRKPLAMDLLSPTLVPLKTHFYHSSSLPIRFYYCHLETACMQKLA